MLILVAVPKLAILTPSPHWPATAGQSQMYMAQCWTCIMRCALCWLVTSHGWQPSAACTFPNYSARLHNTSVRLQSSVTVPGHSCRLIEAARLLVHCSCSTAHQIRAGRLDHKPSAGAGASLAARQEAPSAACSAERGAELLPQVPWAKPPSTLGGWAASGRCDLDPGPSVLRARCESKGDEVQNPTKVSVEKLRPPLSWRKLLSLVARGQVLTLKKCSLLCRSRL